MSNAINTISVRVSADKNSNRTHVQLAEYLLGAIRGLGFRSGLTVNVPPSPVYQQPLLQAVPDVVVNIIVSDEVQEPAPTPVKIPELDYETPPAGDPPAAE